MNPSSASQRSLPRAEVFLFLACLAIAIAPLALRGTSCGQDFDFHLQSWMEAANQWRQGIIYPHWVASANFGAGEPRFVFYPPLSWMLGAFLGTILPWTWTPIAFTLICLVAMGATCYKMAAEWIEPTDALIAACLYVTNPYILFVIYERGACGELLATAWLPLLILYALREQPSFLQLALTVAALWLTNAPAAVMGSYALAVIVLVAAISQRRWNLIARAASAMALGLGLAAIYLIPAIYEQRWVEIARAITPGMRIQDSFLFEHTGMPYHDQVLRTASWIAVFLLIATAIAFVLARRTRKPLAMLPPLLALSVLITFLLLPVSKVLWNIAPELRYLQFPWRWLLLLGLIFAVFAGISTNASIATRRSLALRFTAVVAFAAIFAFHAARHFWIPCDSEDNIRAQIATLHQNGFEGTDEYTTKPADNSDIQQDLPPIRVVSAFDGDQADSSIGENPEYQPNSDDLEPSTIHIQRWQPEHITATIQSQQSGYAILRLMDYPAWRVRVNNQLISRPTGGPSQSVPEWRRSRVSPDAKSRDDGLVAIPIDAGTSVIDIAYAITPDVWAGRILSLVSLALWLALAAISRRATNHPAASPTSGVSQI